MIIFFALLLYIFVDVLTLSVSQKVVGGSMSSLFPEYSTCHSGSFTRDHLWRGGALSIPTYVSAVSIFSVSWNPFPGSWRKCWEYVEFRYFLIFFVCLFFCVQWSRDPSTSSPYFALVPICLLSLYYTFACATRPIYGPKTLSILPAETVSAWNVVIKNYFAFVSSFIKKNSGSL